MKRVLAFLIASVTAGCLWEPYPGWTVKEISRDELPRAVRREISEQHRDDRIVAIEQSTFESRIEGHPKLYRVSFVSTAGLTNRIIYDKKGAISGGWHWFASYDIQHTNALSSPVQKRDQDYQPITNLQSISH